MPIETGRGGVGVLEGERERCLVGPYLVRGDWGEGVSVMAPSHTDTGGHDELSAGVQGVKSQLVLGPKVTLGVGNLVNLVVVTDDWVQQLLEGLVTLRVTGVHAHS